MTLAPFLEWAARRPEAPAVLVEGEVALSYGALREAAARRAGALRAAGLRPGDLLALPRPRGPEWLIDALGCWWLGVAFLPLDPEAPARRNRQILEDARPRASAEEIPREGAPITPRIPAPDDLAYVIYTSGSTGAPKGVEVTHRGLPALFAAQRAAFGVHPEARSLWTLSPSFDASISDVGVALTSGAALLIEPSSPWGPADWMRLLEARRVTHWDLPPALLSLLDPRAAPVALESLIIGGAPCPVDVVRRWSTRVRLVSVYGPTEATVCTHMIRCGPGWDGPHLGAPIEGVEERIVDGELWLSGGCLARGYLGRPEMTAARFIEVEGRRWYRTGDRVTRGADGALYFRGRIDRQIKHRGRLIAPEEVEGHLEAQPEVARAAVRLEGEGVHARLCAHLELRAPVALEALRARLAASLPEWMIPQRLAAPQALPTTPSAKLDGAALPEILTPDEARLAGLWRAALGVTPRRSDDFFALGGDSLQVIALLGAAEAAGVPLSAADVYQGPTLAGMAARLERADGRDVMTAEALREDAPCPAALRGPLAPSPQPEIALLTGATGFLGAHLLAALLRRSEMEIRCLVRAGDQAAARARLVEAARRWGLPSPPPARVVALVGDLRAPDLGLAPRHAAEIDVVYHCAARVNLALDYARLRPDNVEGVINALRFAYTGRPKALHYASTLSVFVSTDRSRGIAYEEDDLSATREVYGGYAQTKWAAEALLQGSSAPIHVYRLGLLTGSTGEGRGPERDWLRYFLRGAARRGALPDVEAEVDITPVDFAADAMARLSLEGPVGVYHLANPTPCRLADLAEALARAGHPTRRVTEEAWRAEASGDPELIASGLAGSRRDHPLDLFQATGIRFDSRRAEAILGERCPPPSPALLNLYVNAALEGLE